MPIFLFLSDHCRRRSADNNKCCACLRCKMNQSCNFKGCHLTIMDICKPSAFIYLSAYEGLGEYSEQTKNNSAHLFGIKTNNLHIWYITNIFLTLGHMCASVHYSHYFKKGTQGWIAACIIFISIWPQDSAFSCCATTLHSDEWGSLLHRTKTYSFVSKNCFRPFCKKLSLLYGTSQWCCSHTVEQCFVNKQRRQSHLERCNQGITVVFIVADNRKWLCFTFA